MAIILDSLVVVGSCAKKLQDIVTEDAILILGVKEDLNELQQTMEFIQCLINDAEQKRNEYSAVNNWLSELKDAVYEADDIIDLAKLEGNRLLENHPSLENSTACTGFSYLTCFPHIQRRHEIAIHIRNFNSKLEKILKKGEQLKLNKTMQLEATVSKVSQMKTSPIVEPNLVGKETALACTRLVDLILAHKETKAYKIGVVGTGGVGKTTLAQKIYNDHKIKGSFSKQAWICVSQQYSDISVLKEVLRNIGVDYKHDETVGEPSKRHIAVENASFFLVLDDIWQHEVWTNLLRAPLNTAATGIILATTRNDTVARAIGVEDIHRVELMSEEVGWELLSNSMNISKESEVENLRVLGDDIFRLCGGLPLAIKVTASVLAAKEKTESEWRKVISKSTVSTSKPPSELSGALYLSYDELPRYLKQCKMHDQKCKMHDLLRKLAQHLSGQDTFCGDEKPLEARSLYKLRRVSVVAGKELLISPSVQKGQIGVRTLITKCNGLKVDSTVFRKLIKIRVLDLTGASLLCVPDCIGSLIHLRSLDLNGSEISYLQESIGSLVNLQILNLDNCDALQSLPLGTTRLCNLRLDYAT